MSVVTPPPPLQPGGREGGGAGHRHAALIKGVVHRVLQPGGGVAGVQGRVASIQLHGGAAVKVEPPHTAEHLQQHHPYLFFIFMSCVITS